MSPNDYWRLAADTSDRVAELIDEIPPWEGCEYAKETWGELVMVAALLQGASHLLRKAAAREARGYSAILKDGTEARP